MIKVIFQHWKTGAHLVEVGYLVHDNPQSDRIVLRKADGTFIDIIKETIVVQEEV